jgi:hypothetical protein
MPCTVPKLVELVELVAVRINADHGAGATDQAGKCGHPSRAKLAPDWHQPNPESKKVSRR